MPAASKSFSRAYESASVSRTSSWSAMPSFPATISRTIPSRSSSGKTTIVQAFEKAVWPLLPICQLSTRLTRVPGGPCRLALSAASRPPAPPPITSTSVSLKIPSDMASPGPRAVLHRGVHVDNPLRAENLAAEAGYAVLAKSNHGQELDLFKPWNLDRDGHGLHVNHVRRTDGVANPTAGALFDLDRFDHGRVRPILNASLRPLNRCRRADRTQVESNSRIGNAGLSPGILNARRT